MVAVSVRAAFDRHMDELAARIDRVAEMVETQAVDAVNALRTRNVLRAEKVSVFDATINKHRYEIEEDIYTLMALQQPNGRDMRRLVSYISVVTNLERMGDHAADIARLVLQTKDCPCVVDLPDFEDMVKLCVWSLKDAMTALRSQNDTLARHIIARDDQIDAIHKRIYDHIIRHMTDQPETIEYATALMWVSHHLERYGDRVSNICDRVIYYATGNLHEPRNDLMP